MKTDRELITDIIKVGSIRDASNVIEDAILAAQELLPPHMNIQDVITDAVGEASYKNPDIDLGKIGVELGKQHQEILGSHQVGRTIDLYD